MINKITNTQCNRKIKKNIAFTSTYYSPGEVMSKFTSVRGAKISTSDENQLLTKVLSGIINGSFVKAEKNTTFPPTKTAFRNEKHGLSLFQSSDESSNQRLTLNRPLHYESFTIEKNDMPEDNKTLFDKIMTYFNN